MDARIDILLDEDGDIAVADGAIATGISDDQNVVLLVESHPGEIKEFPLAGFGASRYLKKTTFFLPQILRNLRTQLTYDGYTDAEISFSVKGELEITV